MYATETARERARKSNGQFGIQQLLDDELAYLDELDDDDPVRRRAELSSLGAAIRHAAWDKTELDGIPVDDGTTAFIVAATDRPDLVARAQARTHLDIEDGILVEEYELASLTANLYDVAVEEAEREALAAQIRQTEEMEIPADLPPLPSDDFIEA